MSGPAESERLARLALSRLGEPGDVRMARLVSEIGAVELYRRLLAHQPLADPDDAVARVTDDVAGRLRGLDPAADLALATHRGMRFVIPGDDEWPTRLGDLAYVEAVDRRGGIPLGVWVRGALRLDEVVERSVAVVGSRSATTYGMRAAADLAAEVGAAGQTLVSGAAFGIDQAAHRGALAVDAPTVAVLACGVDRPYPAAHQDLLAVIAERGLIVSEAAPGWAPTKVRFLSRNRLIAALTCGTVVVEAAHRSGALSTARWASRLHRHLMGVPGPVTSAQSEGVHELIRSQGATLVTRGADVLELLGDAGSHLLEIPRGPERVEDALDLEERQVLDAVPAAAPATAESIARTAGLAVSRVVEIMARLAGRGLVAGVGEGWRLAPR